MIENKEKVWCWKPCGKCEYLCVKGGYPLLLCKLKGNAEDEWPFLKSRKTRGVLPKKEEKFLAIFPAIWLTVFVRGQKTQDDGKRDDAKLAIIQSVIYSPMLYGRGGSLWSSRKPHENSMNFSEAHGIFRKWKISVTTVTEIWSWWPDSNRRPLVVGKENIN